MQKSLALLSLSLTTIMLIGAGCSTTTDSTTEVTNTTSTNTEDSADVAGGTSLAGSDDANTNDTPTTSAVPANLNGEFDPSVEEMVVADDGEVAAETKTFDVVASQFAFSPETITVNEGDTVVLNLTTSDVPHGFSLADFDVSATITPGKTKTVQFVADQTGSFNFTCSVVCGSGHSSMSGTLIVE